MFFTSQGSRPSRCPRCSRRASSLGRLTSSGLAPRRSRRLGLSKRTRPRWTPDLLPEPVKAINLHTLPSLVVSSRKSGQHKPKEDQSMTRKNTVHVRMAAILAAALSIVLAFSARAAQVGSQAPDFHGTDSRGKTQSLDEYRGKFVVLEWHNHDCPYTMKHYESGNMQSLQKQWTAKGVVWFTVISSAPGEQGYVDAAAENAYMAKMGAKPTAAILDPSGAIGKLYGAKTTP